MATYSKLMLSGSTNGKQIKVTGVDTANSITVHQAVNSATDQDEIWIYATNNQAAAVALTLEWGEATVPDGNIVVSVPGLAGIFLVVPGITLQNNLIVKAFAAAANVICLSGYVNRITA